MNKVTLKEICNDNKYYRELEQIIQEAINNPIKRVKGR